MPADKKAFPIVYSCSGCSSAAQMANHIALQLDRQGIAEMSCIAGVGGDVPALLKLAKSGRPIIAIDGCALSCAWHCLARHDVVPDEHLLLSSVGVRKQFHADFDHQQADIIATQVAEKIEQKQAPAPYSRSDAVAYNAQSTMIGGNIPGGALFLEQ